MFDENKSRWTAAFLFLLAACLCDRAQAITFAVGPEPFPEGSGFDVNAPSPEIVCIASTECAHDV
jgi:hypothetical protein